MNACDRVQLFFFFQAEDGIRDLTVTGVQTCALPISGARRPGRRAPAGTDACRLPSVSGSLEQDDPRHAPELLPLGLGVQPSDEVPRSEERRVGKECRSRWSPYH